MSFLIIGGSFVVALLAIIGLVVILRQEQQTQAAPPKPVVAEKTLPRASAPTPTPASAPAPAKAQEPEAITQTLPLKGNAAFFSHDEDEHLALSDGQLHEFAVELRTLHEQAQELEHRLSILTEMIERIQRSQNVPFNADEETYHVQDASPTSAK